MPVIVNLFNNASLHHTLPKILIGIKTLAKLEQENSLNTMNNDPIFQNYELFKNTFRLHYRISNTITWDMFDSFFTQHTFYEVQLICSRVLRQLAVPHLSKALDEDKSGFYLQEIPVEQLRPFLAKFGITLSFGSSSSERTIRSAPSPFSTVYIYGDYRTLSKNTPDYEFFYDRGEKTLRLPIRGCAELQEISDRCEHILNASQQTKDKINPHYFKASLNRLEHYVQTKMQTFLPLRRVAFFEREEHLNEKMLSLRSRYVETPEWPSLKFDWEMIIALLKKVKLNDRHIQLLYNENKLSALCQVLRLIDSSLETKHLLVHPEILDRILSSDKDALYQLLMGLKQEWITPGLLNFIFSSEERKVKENKIRIIKIIAYLDFELTAQEKLNIAHKVYSLTTTNSTYLLASLKKLEPFLSLSHAQINALIALENIFSSVYIRLSICAHDELTSNLLDGLIKEGPIYEECSCSIQ